MSRIIDLTLTLRPGMRGVAWEQAKAIESDGWNARNLHLYSHAGTHMDAQTHFAAGTGNDRSHAARALHGQCLVGKFGWYCGSNGDHGRAPRGNCDKVPARRIATTAHRLVATFRESATLSRSFPADFRRACPLVCEAWSEHSGRGAALRG
ncbi:MAG: hypothetical protein HC845_04115 [Akkermansiaceae bacterium]|nr:hypothetical protein [Akkermansiaceae bacterium]